MIDGKFAILAIESSCDETAAAVVLDGREARSNVISSQIDIHKAYGGVVPEIASRHHLDNVNWVCQKALDDAGATMDEIDAIGVTYGPTTSNTKNWSRRSWRWSFPAAIQIL